MRQRRGGRREQRAATHHLAKRAPAASPAATTRRVLAIAVTAALFDKDVVGVLLVHNVGVEAAIW